MKSSPIADDLNHILSHTAPLWEELRDQRIFVTGGTGFFGCWLLESFTWANDQLQLNAKALVLSRNPEAFAQRAPHLYHHPAVQFLKGDIKDFAFPDGPFSHLIHSAVYRPTDHEKPSGLSLVDEMISGTKRVLEFCVRAKIKKMLLVSTGAVYGEIPANMSAIPENCSNACDPADSSWAYHHGKRMAESLSVLYAKENRFEVQIARCFSFIGPYLQLERSFAVTDFIRDALSKRSITIKSDGSAVRSYLYMADLAIWLWAILFRGVSCRPYNVGSEFPITVRSIAESIAQESIPPLEVAALGKWSDGVAQDYYVPDTSRAQAEIGLSQTIPLSEAITKTMRWYRSHYIGQERKHSCKDGCFSKATDK
jgi:dTDP-glucose 4,6-dehydratase